MNLDEIKKIAAARKTCSECGGTNKRPAWPPYGGTSYETCYHKEDQDRGVTREFIACMANNIDKLLAVVDVVRKIYSTPGHGQDCPRDDEDDPDDTCECGADDIRNALKALEERK